MYYRISNNRTIIRFFTTYFTHERRERNPVTHLVLLSLIQLKHCTKLSDLLFGIYFQKSSLVKILFDYTDFLIRKEIKESFVSKWLLP